MKVQPPVKLVEDRRHYTESEMRRAEVNEHIAAFLSKGGKIQEVTENVLIRKKKSSPVFVIDYTKDSSLYGPYKKTN